MTNMNLNIRRTMKRLLVPMLCLFIAMISIRVSADPVDLDWDQYLEEYPNELPEYLLSEEEDVIGGEAVSEFMEKSAEESVSAQEAASFPAKVDPRSTGKVTSVKNQTFYGTCAAFALVSTMESSLIADGITNNAIDLSEAQLVWAKYKEEGVQDFLTTLNMGDAFNIGALEKGYGPVSESEAPYSAIRYKNENAYSLSDSVWKKSNYDFGYCIDVDYRDTINSTKDLIQKYGGVYGTIYAYDNPSSPYGFHKKGERDDWTYYMPTNYYTNHAVEVVGWDDNYAASSFGTSVPGNGAWLCKNSWGVGKNVIYSEKTANGYSETTMEGGSGYIWVSYYSLGFNPEFAVKMGKKGSVARSFSIPDEIKMYYGKKKNFDMTLSPSAATIVNPINTNYSDGALKVSQTAQIPGKLSFSVAMDFCYRSSVNAYYVPMGLESGGRKNLKVTVKIPEIKMNGLREQTSNQEIVSSGTYRLDTWSSIPKYTCQNQKKYQLDATLDYEAEFCTDPHSLLYESSDPEVVKVNEDGVLEAKSTGIAVITIWNSDCEIPVEYKFAMKVLTEGIELNTTRIDFESCDPKAFSFPIKVMTKEGVDVSDRVSISVKTNGWNYDEGILSYRGMDVAGKEVSEALEFCYNDGMDHKAQLPISIKLLEHKDVFYDIKSKCSAFGGPCGYYGKCCGVCKEQIDYGSFFGPDLSEKGIFAEIDGMRVSLVEGVDYTKVIEDGYLRYKFTDNCKYYEGTFTDYSRNYSDNQVSDDIPDHYSENGQYGNEDIMGGEQETTFTDSASDTGSTSEGNSGSHGAKVATPRASISKITALGRKIRIKRGWPRKARGYEYQCAENRKFTRCRISRTSVRSEFTFRHLDKGRTYYVRIRAYNMDGTRRVYGRWSRIVKVKL